MSSWNLDSLIADHVVQERLAPERMRSLLDTLPKRQFARADWNDETLGKMQEKRDKADLRLRRLLEAVANGAIPPDDPSPKTMTSEAAAERDFAQRAIDRAAAETVPKALITHARIDAFADLMRRKITHGNIGFRRAYLRTIIRRVQIFTEGIKTFGTKSDVERAVLQSGSGDARVPSSVSGWRRERPPRYCFCLHHAISLPTKGPVSIGALTPSPCHAIAPCFTSSRKLCGVK